MQLLLKRELKRPTVIATLKEFVELIEAVERTLSNYSSQLYQQNLESILKDLSPGRNGGLAAAWALCTSGTYRRARAAILSARNGKAPSRILFSEVTAAVGELKRWATAAEGKSLPMRVDDSAKHVAALERLSRDADFLAKILPETRTDQFSIDELTSLASALEADRRTPFQLPKLKQIERSLEAAGVGKLVAEIRLRKPETRLWVDIFQYAWLASALEGVSQIDPEIRGFVGSTHGRYVDDFTHLDEERIALAVERVRRAHGERAIAAMNANPAGEQLIRAQAGKVKNIFR